MAAASNAMGTDGENSIINLQCPGPPGRAFS